MQMFSYFDSLWLICMCFDLTWPPYSLATFDLRWVENQENLAILYVIKYFNPRNLCMIMTFSGGFEADASRDIQSVCIQDQKI